jgi:hypothetical protein
MHLYLTTKILRRLRTFTSVALNGKDCSYNTESGRNKATLGGARVTIPYRPVLNFVGVEDRVHNWLCFARKQGARLPEPLTEDRPGLTKRSQPFRRCGTRFLRIARSRLRSRHLLEILVLEDFHATRPCFLQD